MSLNFDEFNSVVKIFEKQSSMLQDQPYLWRKIDDKYASLTWKEVRSNVERFSTALKNLGILEGDRVVIVSENRPEWQIADLSIMAIGAISVPA
ncbi:MAG: AMP-binding protein, partial [Pelagibacteraceae bacterium]|nr:AMP-binding protein [Pelagibacteraceae bacterium]